MRPLVEQQVALQRERLPALSATVRTLVAGRVGSVGEGYGLIYKKPLLEVYNLQ